MKTLISLRQHEAKCISAEGGVISVADRVSFVVPPGALTTPTVIRVTLEATASGLCFHFQPRGTVFKLPAHLVLPKSHPNAYRHTVPQYRPDDRQRWQPAPFVIWTETEETLLAQIPHFSSYYFIRRQGRLTPHHTSIEEGRVLVRKTAYNGGSAHTNGNEEASPTRTPACPSRAHEVGEDEIAANPGSPMDES